MHHLSSFGCLCLLSSFSFLGRVSHSSSSALLRLRFLTALPQWGCSPLLSVVSVPVCLGFPSSSDLLSLSLASVPLVLFFYSSASHFPSSPRLLCLDFWRSSSLAASSCPPSALPLCGPWPPSSNLGFFATGSSLWAELSNMVVAWDCSSRGRRCSSSSGSNCRFIFFCFCSWLGNLSSA